MTGFLIFVAFIALTLVGGYFKAKKEANSTPLKRSFNRAASLWNKADPKHRAMMLASVGVFEHTPSFSVYLASTWNQLDLNLCALFAATTDTMQEGATFNDAQVVPRTQRNPALDELKLLPQTAITAGLIAAVPGLANELYGESAKYTAALGISDPAFADCVFDLQLTGVFEKAMIFTGNENLASLFVDAMIFKATGKSPSEPTVDEINAGLTDKCRGVNKYAMARKYLPVRDPGALLFGREYARARENGLNQADVDRGLIAALHIRQAGARAANMALTGKSPASMSMGALPKPIDAIEDAKLWKSNAGIDRGENGCEERPTPVTNNVSIAMQRLTDEQLQEQEYFGRHWHRPDQKLPMLEEKKPQNPLQEVGLPTKEQVVSSFQAWQKGGEAGLLEWVKNNQKEED